MRLLFCSLVLGLLGCHSGQPRVPDHPGGYLCYYLQEKGLLLRFYRELRAGVARDPGGVGALKRVLGRTDLGAFQAEWQRFVLGLRFPDE